MDCEWICLAGVDNIRMAALEQIFNDYVFGSQVKMALTEPDKSEAVRKRHDEIMQRTEELAKKWIATRREYRGQEVGFVQEQILMEKLMAATDLVEAAIMDTHAPNFNKLAPNIDPRYFIRLMKSHVKKWVNGEPIPRAIQWDGALLWRDKAKEDGKL